MSLPVKPAWQPRAIRRIPAPHINITSSVIRNDSRMKGGRVLTRNFTSSTARDTTISIPIWTLAWVQQRQCISRIIISHITTNFIVGKSLLLEPHHIKQHQIIFNVSVWLEWLIHFRSSMCTHSFSTQSTKWSSNSHCLHNTKHARYLDTIRHIADDCGTSVWAPHSIFRTEMSKFGSKFEISNI